MPGISECFKIIKNKWDTPIMSLKYSGTERVSCDNPQRNDQIIGIKGYKECHNINGEWNFRLREFCTEKGKLFLYSRFKGGWRLECELVLYCLLKWNGNGLWS